MDYSFTYDGYINLLNTITQSGYEFCNYLDCDGPGKKCILRHDVDNSIEQAVTLAELEACQGIASNFFILLATPFYNVFYGETRDKIRYIASLGHHIGLHFDEVNAASSSDIPSLIEKESFILSEALSLPIQAVSMHRPSANTLNANYQLKGLVNSYSDKFFKEFKYLSDSRRHWREDPFGVIKSQKYQKLQILTHAFWYFNQEKNMQETVAQYIRGGNLDRYNDFSVNFADLESVIRSEEV